MLSGDKCDTEVSARVEQYPVLEMGFAPPTIKSKICKNDINFDHCDPF